MESIYFYIKPLPPFRLDLTVWILRRRPENIVDRWDGQTYRRTILLKNIPLEIAVIETGSTQDSRLKVSVTGPKLAPETPDAVTKFLTKSLGLYTDLNHFYESLREDKHFGPLVEHFRGCKPTRFPSLYEALINGVACQQLSLAVGIRQLNKLSTNFGAALSLPEGVFPAFPQPEDIAGVEVEALRKMGFSMQKARAISELSTNIASGFLDLETMGNLNDSLVKEKLLKLRGVGRWTAEYVMLRGLGRLHIFPADDVGGRKNLARFLHYDQPIGYEGLIRLLGKARPYGGLIYFHLLLNHLAEEGFIAK